MKTETLPNLIIAGTVKGGTTSLFSYLSRHPDICISKVKETCFFLPTRYGKPHPPLSEYSRFFPHNSVKRYVMESTPGYLDGGKEVAQEIRAALGSPKIIFVLRDPTDRLISFYRYHKAQINLPKDLSFEDYIRMCREMPFDLRKRQENDAYWGIDGGMYIHYLPSWFEIFGKDSIRVLFFDNLVASPGATMLSLAAWLGLDAKLFAERQYDVENRTVSYKFGFLQKIAIGTNGTFEPVLRMFPNVKKTVRSLYYLVNSDVDRCTITNDMRALVNQLYVSDNKALADFLALQGYENMPVWLGSKI